MKKISKFEYIVPIIQRVELIRHRTICALSGGTYTPEEEVYYDEDSD